MVGINANIPLVAEDAIDTVFVELIAIGGFDMVCVEVSDNVAVCPGLRICCPIRIITEFLAIKNSG